MKKKIRVENCPFCGKSPELKPYPNGKGYSVRCNTVDCALWPYEIDLQEWNKRKKTIKSRTMNKVLKHFYNVQIIYTSAHFVPVQVFFCKECQKSHTQMDKVKHKRNCTIGKIINASR